MGMGIEGSARVRRAREPRVDEALSSNEAERSRVRVRSFSGRDGGVRGAPSRARSCAEKIWSGARRVDDGRCGEGEG